MVCQLGPIFNVTNILKLKKCLKKVKKKKIKSLVILINTNHRKKNCHDKSLPMVLSLLPVV